MVDEPLGEHQLKLHILPPELNGRAFCGDFFLGHKTLELFVVLGLSVTSWMSGLWCRVGGTGESLLNRADEDPCKDVQDDVDDKYDPCHEEQPAEGTERPRVRSRRV